jgi:exonuclease III
LEPRNGAANLSTEKTRDINNTSESLSTKWSDISLLCTTDDDATTTINNRSEWKQLDQRDRLHQHSRYQKYAEYTSIPPPTSLSANPSPKFDMAADIPAIPATKPKSRINIQSKKENNGSTKENAKHTKTRRGRKKRDTYTEKLVVLGTNANGLNSKKDSFKELLRNDKPQVAMVQETKMKRQNKVKVKGYEIFEKVRKNKGGGGVMIAITNDIEGVPVIVSNHDEEVEILVVEVTINSMRIRFLTGYGPQEDSSEDIINKFYAGLEEEILLCEQENCGLIAELDCNAKLGKELIQGDPNTMSNNGKMLWEIMERRECTVINTTKKCNGVITRSRQKGKTKEESVLDYVIVNAIIAPHVENMEVDESKTKSLTRYKKGKAIPSDHNTLTCTFNIPVEKKSPLRTEIYRLRNEEELRKFKDATTNTDKFTKCFSKEGDINQQGKKWLKELNNTIHTCFKKIRIRQNHSPRNETLTKIEERKNLLKKLPNIKSPTERHETEDQISKIEDEISDEYRKQQLKKVEDHLNTITDKNGKVNTAGAWKLRRKVCPKPLEQLSAKKDKTGELVTHPEKIKDIYLEAYIDRLKHREILPELEQLKALREQLFQKRLEEAKKNKSPPWKMEDLDKVLKKLKSGKATDPIGLVNELFMPENIGQNLKESLLIMINKVKEQYKEPDFMKLANITSFWKRKGAKNDIENERGIFILNVVRMIKDRMIYNDVKPVVRISDSQVGGREEYNVRDHLFIIYSVLNSVFNKESPPVDIHMYDLCKCFDGLWLEECCNNLYEAGITDDKLAMIYEGNKVNNVAVRTPAGLTERAIIERIVTQGGVTGPLCCAVQTDGIGKQSLEEGTNLYYYKGVVGIPTLAMVDDLAKISTCGIESVKDNSYVNAKIEQNKLLFNGPKCHQMHAGKPSKTCPALRAHTTHMDVVSEEKYIGDIISNDGKHTKNITLRRSKGIGISNEIVVVLNSLFLGSHHFWIAKMLRRAMLISVLLFNAETWLRLTKENMRKLESIDLMLLRKLLKTPVSTPKPALYLETGCLPIRYIIKSKRIMYLHHILTRNDDALIKKVFLAQVHDAGKGDWCLVVREDLDTLGLEHLTFDEISKKSKESLRTLINDKIDNLALLELEEEKQKLSKVAGIPYTKLEMQAYLSDAELTTRLKQLAFRWRTRMIKVGWNYGTKQKCPICLIGEDTQTHLLECRELNGCNNRDEDNDNNDDDNDNDYNNQNKNKPNNNIYNPSKHMLRRLEAALRKREVILEQRDQDASK